MMKQTILPGISLTVDVSTKQATLHIGTTTIPFAWNEDARRIFEDLEGACPIELLSIIGEVEKYVAGE